MMKGSNMRKTEAIPSRYYRAKDMPDGWTLAAEIETARMEDFEGDRGKGATKKMVVYFRRQKSGLVVGSVVWDQLIEVTGEEDSDHWKGHVVELFKTETPFGRDVVDCIRVRKPVEPQKKAKKPVVHHDDADDFRDSAND
jgi:hypothetical protein